MFAKLVLFFTLFLLTVIRSEALDSKRNSQISIRKVAEPVTFGEGPHWDVRSQKLYYVDITSQKILRYDPATGKTTYAYIKNGPLSVVVPVKDSKNKLIVGVNRNVILVTWDGEHDSDNPPIEILSYLDTDRHDTTTDDGKCDAAGRFWIGTLSSKSLSASGEIIPNRGALYSIGKNGIAKKKVSPVSLSNGMTWSVENDTMYYIDSLTKQIVAYDYNIVDGSITNKRVVFDLEANKIKGIPDGMTNDSNDNLWIAIYNGTAIIQVDPRNGKLLRKITMPVMTVTSVAFGGSKLNTVYVTSRNDGTMADSGSLFSIKGLGVKGCPANDFIYNSRLNCLE